MKLFLVILFLLVSCDDHLIEPYDVVTLGVAVDGSGRPLDVDMDYVPDYRDISNYHNIIRYRLGFQYNSTYLKFENEPIIQQKICFGLGLPFRKTGSFLNLSFEIGQRGTTEYNLIKEQFVNILLGFKFNDIWFIKRKYD